MFPFDCFVILFVSFFLGPSWETPELKNELDFFSGTNRPLASSARAQDITIYENSSAD